MQILSLDTVASPDLGSPNLNVNLVMRFITCVDLRNQESQRFTSSFSCSSSSPVRRGLGPGSLPAVSGAVWWEEEEMSGH